MNPCAETAALVALSLGSPSALASNPGQGHVYFGLGLGIGYRLMRNLSVDDAVDASRIKLLGNTANTALWSLGLSATF